MVQLFVMKFAAECIHEELSPCFAADYHGITGETIPFKQLGFSNMADFIKSIPDVVFVKQ